MSNLCSVVCVCYNHAQFAAAGLQSIFDQTYRNIEIIVLDDGSTDTSVEVIEQMLAQSPFKTRFIKQENKGNVPGNFNTAIDAAVGEFVTMMSLDDMLLPDCIRNAVEILSKSDHITFAANTGHYEIDKDGKRLTPDTWLPPNSADIRTAAELLEIEYESLGAFYIQGQVFRRDALLAVGCFDDTMTGDDIVLRTRLFQHMIEHPEMTFSLGTDVVLAYRKHGDNLHRNTFRQIKTIIEWKEKYFPDRPYPDLFYNWLNSLLKKYVRNGMVDELQIALAFNPVIAARYEMYKKTGPFYRHTIKGNILRLIGRQ